MSTEETYRRQVRDAQIKVDSLKTEIEVWSRAQKKAFRNRKVANITFVALIALSITMKLMPFAIILAIGLVAYNILWGVAVTSKDNPSAEDILKKKTALQVAEYDLEVAENNYNKYIIGGFNA